MSEGYKIRSLSEIVNEILSTVRSYYDAEYAYYIEKDRGDIETIYEQGSMFRYSRELCR